MTTSALAGYTPQELAHLTPDELEAMQSDAGDGDDELDRPVEAKQPVDAPIDPPADGAQAPEAEAADERAYAAETPADADATTASIKDAKAAAKKADRDALKQLHEGEIDFAEYETIKNTSDDAIEAANDQLTALNRAIDKAEISSEMTQQQLQKAWSGEVATMLKQGKAEGLDYAGNDALNKEFNSLVRVFGQEATDRNMSDVGLVASKWALAQAHDMMKLRHAALVVRAPAAKTDPNKPRIDLTSLSRMPAADRSLIESDSISRYANLQGEDLERAMASMSKADMEKLMASV